MSKAPALIMIGLWFVGLLVCAYMHGKPKQGTYSIWAQLINVSISALLLYWGGFFDTLLGK